MQFCFHSFQEQLSIFSSKFLSRLLNKRSLILFVFFFRAIVFIKPFLQLTHLILSKRVQILALLLLERNLILLKYAYLFHHLDSSCLLQLFQLFVFFIEKLFIALAFATINHPIILFKFLFYYTKFSLLFRSKIHNILSIQDKSFEKFEIVITTEMVSAS